ncbi:fused response regulator/phosphatase [Thiorhodovibrio frisius]|uniref:Response regulator with CheY-like receiver domain and winged-helix DNA-binding domain n=1 Tax=Thiorhodovibrio frisius TaxID=631362 RepID=H8Z5S6_9GAMM|nr:fused response regulator/phosphatase [Thiorhodovibrio frisius]EIC19560.1 response regulator with CheY-like receiver domain and winged-helix DNA-binding domain [Thiorhodovibrio frisius]WPL20478.1 Alkaline phosphatase synthesis transcriptional regulatory protein PhoP [Thiorhodovibrio frisius]
MNTPDTQAQPDKVAAATSRGKALVVDDEPTNCRLLTQMLLREGFDTVEAHNGEEAIAKFDTEHVDIVFMDVMMPGMDGFEATRIIKARTGSQFVPVIFLTALRDEKSLIQCTEAGGDDFLSKPFSFGILKARIRAMERVRNLQRAVARKNEALSALIEKDQEEQKLAERLLSRAVNTRNAATGRYHHVQRPATTFSGDLVLSQYLPDGGLRILIADFTGHGLAAAIGAMPVSDIFHTMTLKGADDERVLSEINRKLYQLLPADRFMAAWLISISHTGTTLRWWNGGMPSGWMQTRHGLVELGSHSLPLGIMHPLPEQEHANYLQAEPTDRLLLMSDGLLETGTNPDGKMFEDTGFQKVLDCWSYGEPVMESLIQSLDDLRSGDPLDDITIVEIPLGSSEYTGPQLPKAALQQSGWEWSIELADARLDALPLLEEMLGPLGLLEGMHNHAGALQTIITELYTNALEHGVLKLESKMKSTPDGFELYYRERERRLAMPTPGWIKLSLSYQPSSGHGGRIRIMVRDSGSGFNDQQPEQTDASQPWGRGIKLVRDLCESVHYGHDGAEVVVTYAW